MKLGVLGGTFDPVHMGHLMLGESAREELGLDKVLFVPAGQPWRKADREITAAEHRVAMLRLATEENPAFEVSLVEVERNGPSYTVDTLEALSGEDRELYCILGVDAFEDLPNWKEPKRIAELAVLAVTGRPGYREGVEVSKKLLSLRLGERVVWFHMPKLGMSASAIREHVRLGKSIRYLVPEAVEDYIRAHGLYR